MRLDECRTGLALEVITFRSRVCSETPEHQQRALWKQVKQNHQRFFHIRLLRNLWGLQGSSTRAANLILGVGVVERRVSLTSHAVHSEVCFKVRI